MSTIEIILVVWLGVGLANVLQAWLKGILSAGVVEVLFFLFLWPLQASFFVIMRIPNVIENAYSFLAGERRGN